MFQFPKTHITTNVAKVAVDKAAPSWHKFEDEGELKVDVFETDDSLIIRSTVAGTRPEDLDIFLNNDLLTIRGKRTEEHEVKKNDYHIRECFWGKFSRSIVLPRHAETRGAEAILKNGLLTIKLPKAEARGNIVVKEEE